ncbi:hypothetical protein ACRBEV_05600 [Methylobacterium phyllosphaerae]
MPTPDESKFVSATSSPALSFRLIQNAGIYHRGTLLIFTVGALCAALLYLRVVSPYFLAASTIIIDYKAPTLATQGTASDAVDFGYIDTQILIMESDEIVGEVADQLQLKDDSEFLINLQLTPAEDTASAISQQIRRSAAIAELKRRLRVRRVGRSYVAEIEVGSRDPEKAARLANTVATVYIEKQAGMRIKLTERANSPALARMIAPAEVPHTRSGSKGSVLIGLSGVFGLSAGFCIAMLREFLSGKVRSAEDLERALGLRCIASIPEVRDVVSGEMNLSRMLDYSSAHPKSDFANSFRVVASSLILESRTGDCLTIGLIGTAKDVGSSVIAANISSALARFGRRVLLIDANPNEPDLSRQMGGLICQDTSNLEAPPGNPRCTGRDNGAEFSFLSLVTNEELPGAARYADYIKRVIAESRESYEYILLDLPDLKTAADMILLFGIPERAILVSRWGSDKSDRVMQAVRALPGCGALITSFLLSRNPM